MHVHDVISREPFRVFGGSAPANTRVELSDNVADPGEENALVLLFTPVAVGSYVGSLEFRSDAANRPFFVVGLNAMVTGIDLRIEPV